MNDRTRIAALCLQGILANPGDAPEMRDRARTVEMAFGFADLLMAHDTNTAKPSPKAVMGGGASTPAEG